MELSHHGTCHMVVNDRTTSLVPCHVVVIDRTTSLVPCHVVVIDRTTSLVPCHVVVIDRTTSLVPVTWWSLIELLAWYPVTWWSLIELLAWYPVAVSTSLQLTRRLSNSRFIYQYSDFKRLTDTCIISEGTSIVVPIMATRWHILLNQTCRYKTSSTWSST